MKQLSTLLILLSLTSTLNARLWTSNAGKTFEGEIVEISESRISIRRQPDNTLFEANLKLFCVADHIYVLEERLRKAENKRSMHEIRGKESGGNSYYKAKKLNTFEDYQVFLFDYPESKYRAEAKKRRDRILTRTAIRNKDVYQMKALIHVFPDISERKELLSYIKNGFLNPEHDIAVIPRFIRSGRLLNGDFSQRSRYWNGDAFIRTQSGGSNAYAELKLVHDETVYIEQPDIDINKVSEFYVSLHFKTSHDYSGKGFKIKIVYPDKVPSFYYIQPEPSNRWRNIYRKFEGKSADRFTLNIEVQPGEGNIIFDNITVTGEQPGTHEYKDVTKMN